MTTEAPPKMLEILVEEPSMQKALAHLIPKLLNEQNELQIGIRIFQGKKNLLKELPDRLRGYRRQTQIDWRILVLVDEDRQDCRTLKYTLENIALYSGFPTKAARGREGTFQVVTRIAIEELEVSVDHDFAGKPLYPPAPFPHASGGKGEISPSPRGRRVVG